MVEFIVKIEITESERTFLKQMLQYHLNKENVNKKLIPIATEIFNKLEKSKTFFEELLEEGEKERKDEMNTIKQKAMEEIQRMKKKGEVKENEN